jgi:hypothetical protein
MKPLSHILVLGLGLGLASGFAYARPKNQPAAAPLTEAGEKLTAQYADMLSSLQKELVSALPKAAESKKKALVQAQEEMKKAETAAAEAQKNLGSIAGAQALIGHAKGKWIGSADKGIAKSQAEIKAAKTPAAREAAEKELAKWQANRAEGVKALEERTAAYEKAKVNEPQYKKAHETAQAALAKAQENEMKAANALLADLSPVVASDKLDAKLVKGALLAHATPRGLAEFAQNDPGKAALISQLLGDTALMKDMLVSGGARFGQYGRAMEIYTAIRKASPKSHSGNLQRLALGTSLEHARPIAQSSPKDATAAQTTVDPVKRYLHYEKAFLAGELDPAFKNLTTWEYRHVVNCDAPDEILTWGREMLRNYRPDHIYFPNYGWRYVNAVKTEVPYGSQNVQYDDPARHNYQNIIRNGGICGRRAFFGRFILRSFGIPTWGVTQRAHAALSHWTPNGWVVNLGAGYNSSWWDKDDVSLSGAQFLQETQARAHGDDYLRVLRAEWVSRILGEEAYNDRKKIAGGFWSGMANYMSSILAAKQVALGPLGQELGEANEEQKVESVAVSSADQKVRIAADGTITIPSVAHTKAIGKAATMKSYAGGMQLHALSGYKNQYEFEAPKAGQYQWVAQVATVQTGQKFLLSANDAAAPVETDVPYTLGMWEYTKPVEVSLVEGKNILHFELKPGSKGVTIKDFLLKPVK